MSGKIINYFAGGNTAKGFQILYESNFKDLKHLLILKGGHGTGKSTLLKEISDHWANQGYDIEVLHCPLENGSIDGLIIKKLKIGIVDGTDPTIINVKALGDIVKYINLGEALDSTKLMGHYDEITALANQKYESLERAYSLFAEALKVHDEWEKIYIMNMNFVEGNKITEELIKRFFGTIKLNKQANVKHRFLGAATPEGAVDFIQNLTEDVANRYFIKGRPGSGKSTMLRKLARTAEEKGLDVEIYHCGFDPNSLDMVIVRELGIAVFDSTAPHEHFPDQDHDEIIDMYERTIKKGTDEKFKAEINEIKGRYSTKMKEATTYLEKAKAFHDQLKSFFIEAADFTVIDEIKSKLQAEINEIAQTMKE